MWKKDKYLNIGNKLIQLVQFVRLVDVPWGVKLVFCFTFYLFFIQNSNLNNLFPPF